MKNPIRYMKRSLSFKLGLGIVCFVAAVFIAALGILFERSRRMVRNEATERATHVLNNTTLHVVGYLNEIETATHNIEWLVMQNLKKDSLLLFTRRVVELNPTINGCSITMEPNFFGENEDDFSAHSVRVGSDIETAREGQYDYYSKVWYRTPRSLKKACWVDPFDDFNEGTLSSIDMIASYCKPMFDHDGNVIGVISTDLSMKWLTRAIENVQPYPNSYCIMLGEDGHYFVHPDFKKLIHQTIFTDIDPEQHPDIIAIGHQMLAGKTGNMKATINGEPCIVFFQPVPKTAWSIALVCPESDILNNYNQLAYIVVPLLIVGLLLMLFFCLKTISHFIEPLSQLVHQTHDIANGNFSKRMPKSERTDVMGLLQNSVVTMQESIDNYVSHIQQVNTETEARNNELAAANQQAQKAARQNTLFIQDVSLQIRTPLNIIAGFMQVIRDTFSQITREETSTFADIMQQNSTTVTRMIYMLFDASRLDNDHQQLDLTEEVAVNDVAREAIEGFRQKPPKDMVLQFDTHVPDSLHIHTNHSYLFRTLRELLFNAKKYASEGTVTVTIDTIDNEQQATDNRQGTKKKAPTFLRFTVEDTGRGIAEADRERVFTPFIKLDKFSEGLGLGLGLSLRSAQLLGGRLILDPTYTQGARFILEIPNA